MRRTLALAAGVVNQVRCGGRFVAIDIPRLLVIAGVLALVASCGPDVSDRPATVAMVTRSLGTWEGRGNRTLGFGSDSGRFRVTWQARGEAAGTFRLAVHSAVSGRPIQLITDQRGPSGGSVNVDDDPRQYNLMIDSSAIDWSVSVEELVASRPQ